MKKRKIGLNPVYEGSNPVKQTVKGKSAAGGIAHKVAYLALVAVDVPLHVLDLLDCVSKVFYINVCYVDVVVLNIGVYDVDDFEDAFEKNSQKGTLKVLVKF